MAQAPAMNPGHNLLHLPCEHLLCVSEDLAPDDLLSLAGVSRDLHHLAIGVLLNRFNVDLDSPTISLQCKDRTIEALPALGIALSTVNTSPTRLSCDLTRHLNSLSEMITEARLLMRYISKLASVEEIVLQLMHPPFTQWEEVVLGLLEVVLLKSCTHLSIKSLESSLSWSISSPDSQTMRWPAFLPISRNASAISDLFFKCVFNSKDWETLSGRISLPSLSSLSISHCAVIPSAPRKFLIRHPSIVSLVFHHNMMMPIHLPRLPTGVLPRLSTLQTSSDYIIHYFPSMETFADLAWIQFPLGDKYHGFDRADDALSCLSSCSTEITLCLEFGNVPGVEAWLKGKEEQAKEQNVEFSLRCVKTLKVDTLLRDGFTSAALVTLPRWLALFPALQHLSVAGRCFREDSPEMFLDAFIHAITRACLSMKTILLLSATERRYIFPPRHRAGVSNSNKPSIPIG